MAKKATRKKGAGRRGRNQAFTPQRLSGVGKMLHGLADKVEQLAEEMTVSGLVETKIDGSNKQEDARLLLNEFIHNAGKAVGRAQPIEKI